MPIAVPVVGVFAFGIVVGVDFGNVCAGIVAGAGVAAGVAAGIAAAVFDGVLAPYQSFTPLWPWQAPFLFSPV